MKRIISFIIFLFPIFILAQTSDTIKPKSIAIGLTYSPDFCYRITNTNSDNQWMKDQFDTLEVAKFGFTTGINLDYQFTQKISLSTGILYSDKGEQLRSKIIPTIEKYVDHIHYLDIPLKVNYNIINKNTKIFISAGISSNLFLSSKILMQKENSSSRELIIGNSEFSKLNFTSIIGAGLKTNFSPKWSFKFELIYRQSITTVMDAPVKKYFYSIGSNCGLFYTL